MSKTILVIDNDADYIEAVSTMLEANGYRTISALDGDKGVAAAKSMKPSCILLDVMMQYVSEGLDAAVKLRDDPATASIPVILITGIRKPQYLTLSFRPGESFPNVKGMFEKPVKPAVLLEKISAILK